MNLLITRAERECRGPLTDNKDRYPSCRAFMDDLSVTTESQAGTRWILKALEVLATWARLQFKPQKSRSLVIHKGKKVHHSFTLQQTEIPTIQDQPIKCLGKWFTESLNDVQTTDEVVS